MTMYRLRESDPAFAAEWDQAKRIGAEALEDEARRRAHDGWDEPVHFQGQMVDTVRKFSDTLLIFLLKGAMPDKYRERSSVDLAAKVDVSSATDEQLRDELRTLLADPTLATALPPKTDDVADLVT